MIIARIVSLLIGYILGTFQTGYFYGKSQGVDIREHGSGNAGTTNTLRTLGIKAGAITFAGDLLKALLAVLTIWLVFGKTQPEGLKLLEFYGGFGTVLGHNFPFYLKFKGGKGIACTAGVVLAVCPAAVPVCLLLFLLPLAITRYVSLSSLCMVTGFMIQVVLFNYFGLLQVTDCYVVEFNLLAVCFAAMAFWRHRANIVRLASGTENKLGHKAK